MTPSGLAALLGLDAVPAEPERLLHVAERAAEANPCDRQAASLVLDACAMVTASAGLRQIEGGVRREALVRWDAWSTTWRGVRDDDEGTVAMVRVLRPGKGPVHLRALDRDRKALEPLIPGLVEVDRCLVAPLPGTPWAPGGEREVVPAVRLLATGLGEAAAWAARGLGLPRLAVEEVRDDGRNLHLVCLTPDGDTDQADIVGRLVAGVRTDDPFLAPTLAGLAELPPANAAEALEILRSALGKDLRARAVELSRRRILHGHGDRRQRLYDTLARLEAGVPRPHGVAAIGVDLEGRTTTVRADGSAIRWGPPGEEVPVWTDAAGFDPPQARRLLRARAAAPNNPILQRAVGGSDQTAENVCRWVSAGLKVRTLRLLLERTS